MPRNPPPKDHIALVQRAKAVTADIHDVLQELEETRQIAQAIVEQARQIHPDTVWRHHSTVDARPVPVPGVSTDEEYQAVAMEILRAFRAVLGDFPLRWQVHIVKVLTAHVLAAGKQQLDPPTALSA